MDERLEDEVYQLRLSLEKQLSEIRKMLIPVSLYFSEKLKEIKE